ncbi:hypothetical protein ABH945_003650 [Paraburkholderia sp. GAS333]|uniref:hypothetical protein n=1 Tax=Paraburkholderia sp. GAS333 TaxID=3156279 RepID=UPI003D220E48
MPAANDRQVIRGIFLRVERDAHGAGFSSHKTLLNAAYCQRKTAFSAYLLNIYLQIATYAGRMELFLMCPRHAERLFGSNAAKRIKNRCIASPGWLQPVRPHVFERCDNLQRFESSRKRLPDALTPTKVSRRHSVDAFTQLD